MSPVLEPHPRYTDAPGMVLVSSLCTVARVDGPVTCRGYVLTARAYARGTFQDDHARVSQVALRTPCAQRISQSVKPATLVARCLADLCLTFFSCPSKASRDFSPLVRSGGGTSELDDQGAAVGLEPHGISDFFGDRTTTKLE